MHLVYDTSDIKSTPGTNKKYNESKDIQEYSTLEFRLYFKKVSAAVIVWLCIQNAPNLNQRLLTGHLIPNLP